MPRRSSLISAAFCVFSAAALCWALTATAGASAAPASARPQVAATPPPPPPAGPVSPAWGHAEQAPGIDTLDDGGGGALEAVACPAKGACTAGGFYYDGVTAKQQGFVIDEADGLWGDAQDVPTLPELNTGGTADVLTVACLAGAPGECGAGGFYRDATGLEGFMGSEVGGTWDGSIELPGSGGGAEVSAEACPAFARCVIGGYISDSHGDRQPFVDSEGAAGWPAAQVVPGNLNAGGSVEVTSLACTSVGNCVAGGTYTDAKDMHQAFVVTEKGAVWGSMKELAGSLNKGENAAVNQVSCGVSPTLISVITCAAVGFYAPSAGHVQAFTATMANGTWGPAVEVPGLAALNKGGEAEAQAVSCPTAGNCSVGGEYSASASSQQVFVVTEKNGTWGKAIEVPGTAAMNTGGDAFVVGVSCVAPGKCGIAGDYHTKNHSEGVWVASQKAGTWGKAGTIPGLSYLSTGGQAEVEGLSCATNGSCGLVGDYYTMNGSQQPFVASGSIDAPTTTTMALSAASVVYGHEQAERVSVTVVANTGAPPTGTVTIKAGNTVACAITLHDRQGACTVPAAKFGPGTVTVAAYYGGAIVFQTSHSVAQTFTVVKATTKTALALSASAITFGQEQSERLSVAVAPQFGGIPAGTVTIKAGSRTLCAVTLKSGKGSCTLTPKELKPGTYQLTASYPGGTDFTGSASGPKTLTVGKAT